jgi:hypothetical protein
VVQGERAAFTVHRSPFAVRRSPFTVHRSPFGRHFGLARKNHTPSGREAQIRRSSVDFPSAEI